LTIPWSKQIQVDSVVNCRAAVSKSRETSANLIGDKITATDDAIRPFEAGLDHFVIESCEPLAVHVKYDPSFRADSPGNWSKLREVSDVNDVAISFSKTGGKAKGVN
jgi:hypothetical protein